MAKKIKSFTVDENIYNRLVAMFKKYKAETSVSLYLSNQVKYLLEQLEDLEKGIEEKNYSVPMSYIIDETVKAAGNRHRLSKETYDDSPISELEECLNDWQKEYDADQEGIPPEYFEWIKMGGYILSKDNKFLINKETGKKYISGNRGSLMEVREIESKE